ncbi:MAG: adenosylmethionine decarboxylase [Candidatus Firestonebacteria bacterium]
MKALGRHVLAEMYDCHHEILNNQEEIKDILIKGAEEANATVVETVVHKFNPYGLSGVVVIAESHLSIHTWPEYNFAALDLFTCGEVIDPWVAFEYIAKRLQAQNYTTMEVKRGSLHIPDKELTHKPANVSV